MSTSRRSSGRRYTTRFVVAMTAYTVLLVAGISIANAIPESPWRYAAALLPVPAVITLAWALWRYVIEADELQSRMLLEGLGMSIAGTGICTFAYGMLQIVGAPALGWIWVLPMLLAWFGVGAAVTNLRYRS